MKSSNWKISRVGLLMFFTLAVMVIFITRLFYLQVIRHSYYVDLASSEQFKQLVIPAERGEIYALDRDKPVKLVLNQTVYTVFADPKIIANPDEVVDVIEGVAGGSARSNLASLLANKESRYQVLATNVTKDQAEMIKEANLGGVGFKKETRRVYPEGQLASQVLGFVDANNTGQYGVEGKLNGLLAGEDGLLRSVTDIRNVPLTIGDKNINQPSKNGSDIVLTIDRNVQAYTEQALKRGLDRSGAQRGSVIVMNPKTAEVMAMANLPTYNPSEFSRVDDIGVFNNPIIHTPYEPGSNIKILTLAIGIDKGVLSPSTTYHNTDYITVGDRTITNATKGQVGNVSFQHALNYSLNTGFVTIAKLLGDGRSITLPARQVIYQYFHDRFRMGRVTGIELTGESAGTIVLPNDPNGAAVRYSNMTFGQGMDVTMVQVAAALSSLINGGTYHYPTVIAGTIEDNGQFTPAERRPPVTGIVKKSTSDTMYDMTVKARRSFFASGDMPGYEIGGKTGTSQAIKNGRYVFSETVGTYLGFGGADSPEYVIMVQVSGDNMTIDGGRDTLPIFTDISNWMIDYLQLQPKR